MGHISIFLNSCVSANKPGAFSRHYNGFKQKFWMVRGIASIDIDISFVLFGRFWCRNDA